MAVAPAVRRRGQTGHRADAQWARRCRRRSICGRRERAGASACGAGSPLAGSSGSATLRPPSAWCRQIICSAGTLSRWPVVAWTIRREAEDRSPRRFDVDIVYHCLGDEGDISEGHVHNPPPEAGLSEAIEQRSDESIRDQGGEPGSRQVGELLDERLNNSAD